MWWLFILAGLAGGLVGGMGMGGGTLLVPILTIFLGVGQHLAQGLNLLVFIPTGIIAIIIHAKNKLLDYKTFFYIIIPAVGTSIGFAFLANSISSEVLSTVFGYFLLAIGVAMLVFAIVGSVKRKREKEAGNEAKS